MNPTVQHEHLFLGREGFATWHASLASSCGTFHVEPPPGPGIATFCGAVTAVDSEHDLLQGARITSNCSHVYRQPQDIRRDDRDFFYLIMQLSGEALICQADARTRLQGGDLVLLDAARPSDFYFDGLSDQVSLILPRKDTLQRLGSRELCLNRHIDSRSAIGSMGAMLVRQLVSNRELSCEESLALLDATLAVLRPALAPQRSGTAHGGCPDLLVKARAIIERRLGEEDLCPEQVAAATGTSVRSLHRLFARSGVTIGRYIIDRRLQRCAQALEHSDLKIGHIAASCGFKDLAHFSRAFKHSFGMAPRDYRQGKAQHLA